jgi:predicted nucleic acid-binding protein
VSGFLLDTNVVSELIKRKPEPKLTAWIGAAEENLFHLSVLTLGEIRKGINSLLESPRRTALESWLNHDLVIRFAHRILDVDQAVSDRWGRLAANALGAKQLLPVIDGLLAATAIHHNLTLVTRNAKDVALTGVPLINPWAT